jgi:hypothetical protein
MEAENPGPNPVVLQMRRQVPYCTPLLLLLLLLLLDLVRPVREVDCQDQVIHIFFITADDNVASASDSNAFKQHQHKPQQQQHQQQRLPGPTGCG